MSTSDLPPPLTGAEASYSDLSTNLTETTEHVEVSETSRDISSSSSSARSESTIPHERRQLPDGISSSGTNLSKESPAGYCYSRGKSSRSPVRQAEVSLHVSPIEKMIHVGSVIPLTISITQKALEDLKIQICVFTEKSQKKLKKVLELDKAAVIPADTGGVEVKLKFKQPSSDYQDQRFFLRVSCGEVKKKSVKPIDTNLFLVIEKYVVVVVGDKDVGKSWFVDEYIKADGVDDHKAPGRFSLSTAPSLSRFPEIARPHSKEQELERPKSNDGKSDDSAVLRAFECQVNRDRPILISLWDTSGADEFKQQRSMVLTEATNLVLICFSLVDVDSYYHLDGWLAEVKKQAPNAVIAIVGLQSDRRSDLEQTHPDQGQKWVTTEEATFFAKNKHAEYMECSALDKNSVWNVFGNAIKLVSQSRTRQLQDERPKRWICSCSLS